MTLHPRWERLIHFAATYRADIVRAEFARVLAEHDADSGRPLNPAPSAPPVPDVLRSLSPEERESFKPITDEQITAALEKGAEAVRLAQNPAALPTAPPERPGEGRNLMERVAELESAVRHLLNGGARNGFSSSTPITMSGGKVPPADVAGEHAGNRAGPTMPSEQPGPTCGCDARGRSCGCRYPSACSCDSPRGERCMCRCHAQTASLEVCTMAIPPRTWGKTRIMDTAQAAPDGGRLSERMRDLMGQVKRLMVTRGPDGRLHSPPHAVLDKLLEFRGLADEVDALEDRLAAAGHAGPAAAEGTEPPPPDGPPAQQGSHAGESPSSGGGAGGQA